MIRATPAASSVLAKLLASHFLLTTVFARRRGYRRRAGMRLVSTAPLAVIATDFYVASMLVALDNCRPRLFVDCRVRRVQLGGHDRNRCDHRHIVIVVSTAMRPSSRLPSCSRTTIYRRCRRCSLPSTFVVVAPRDRRCRRCINDDATLVAIVVSQSRPFQACSRSVRCSRGAPYVDLSTSSLLSLRRLAPIDAFRVRRSCVVAAVIKTTIRPAPAASFGIRRVRGASLALGSRSAF
jgi:hypothetical protein